MQVAGSLLNVNILVGCGSHTKLLTLRMCLAIDRRFARWHLLSTVSALAVAAEQQAIDDQNIMPWCSVRYILQYYIYFPCLTAYASPALRTRGKTSEGQIEKSSFASPILRTAGATCSKLSFFFPYLTYKLSPYLRTKQRNIYDGYATNPDYR